jgi:hypothetical protein
MKTNKELCAELGSVVGALNTVVTSGTQNLLNLGGSINLINEVIKVLNCKPEPDKTADVEEGHCGG